MTFVKKNLLFVISLSFFINIPISISAISGDEEEKKIKQMEEEALQDRSNYEIIFDGKKIIERNRITKSEKEISSFLVSPSGENIVYFEEIYTYRPSEEAKYIGVDFIDYTRYRVHIFNKKNKKKVIDLFYSYVFGWSGKGKQKEYKNRVSWSPSDAYMILSPEGWAGAPGSEEYTVVNILKKRIFTIWMTRYEWLDEHIIVYDYTGDGFGHIIMRDLRINVEKKIKELEGDQKQGEGYDMYFLRGLRRIADGKNKIIKESTDDYTYFLKGVIPDKKLIIGRQYNNCITSERENYLRMTEPEAIGSFVVDLNGNELYKIFISSK